MRRSIIFFNFRRTNKQEKKKTKSAGTHPKERSILIKASKRKNNDVKCKTSLHPSNPSH